MENVCLFCLNPLADQHQRCSKCGKSSANYQAKPHHLPVGTRLNYRYRIYGVIAEKGTLIEYCAEDELMRTGVRLKEIYVPKLCKRNNEKSLEIDSKKDFEELCQTVKQKAQVLMGFSYERNIETILEIFEANQTIVVVCEMMQGKKLSEYLVSRERMSFSESYHFIEPVLHLLQHLHLQQIYHQNIQLDSLFIDDQGGVILCDFNLGSEMSEQDLVSGFACLEQYKKHRITSACDIYAISAVLYYMVSKINPKNATQIKSVSDLTSPRDLGALITNEESNIILHGMHPNVQERIASIRDFMDEVNMTSFNSSTMNTKLNDFHTNQFVVDDAQAIEAVQEIETIGKINGQENFIDVSKENEEPKKYSRQERLMQLKQESIQQSQSQVLKSLDQGSTKAMELSQPAFTRQEKLEWLKSQSTTAQTTSSEFNGTYNTSKTKSMRINKSVVFISAISILLVAIVVFLSTAPANYDYVYIYDEFTPEDIEILEKASSIDSLIFENIEMTQNVLDLLENTKEIRRVEFSQVSGDMDLSVLEGKHIEVLEIVESEVDSFNFLHGISTLENLTIESTEVDTLEGLSSSSQLQYVTLNNIGLTSLNDIPDLEQLHELDVANNQLVDLDGVEKFEHLSYLILRHNQIESTEGINNLTDLVSLDISHNLISEMPNLHPLTSLYRFHASHNQISDFTMILAYQYLNELDISYNPIEQEDILKIIPYSVSRLNLSGLNITDLSWLSSNTGLIELYINDNQLTDLSFIDNFDLYYLSANNNFIEDISPIVRQQNINEVYLSGNLISDISVLVEFDDHYTSLSFDLSNNQISDVSTLLGLYGNDVLYAAYLHGNPIENQDFFVAVGESYYMSNLSISYDESFDLDDLRQKSISHVIIVDAPEDVIAEYNDYYGLEFYQSEELPEALDEYFY